MKRGDKQMDLKTTGTIYGTTIRLNSPLNVSDGAAVEVTVRPVGQHSKWGEGILRSAGGWENYPEMDAIMTTIQEQRKLERRTDLP
jgi:hypothetical protein